MKIFIGGISGTGKTTIKDSIKQRGISAIDIDEISRWVNKETNKVADWDHDTTNEWYDTHKWVVDVKKLKKFLKESTNSIVFGGYASNQDNYLNVFDDLYLLTISSETMLSRIENRTNNDFGKNPVEKERILSWKDKYERIMKEKGAKVIDTEQPINEVVETVISKLKIAL